MIVLFAWIFFRANNLSDALWINSHLTEGLSAQLSQADLLLQSLQGPLPTRQMLVFLLVGLLILWFIDRKLHHQDIHEFFASIPQVLRWLIYYSLFASIIFLGAWEDTQQFIYFQF